MKGFKKRFEVPFSLRKFLCIGPIDKYLFKTSNEDSGTVFADPIQVTLLLVLNKYLSL